MKRQSINQRIQLLLTTFESLNGLLYEASPDFYEYYNQIHDGLIRLFGEIVKYYDYMPVVNPSENFQEQLKGLLWKMSELTAENQRLKEQLDCKTTSRKGSLSAGKLLNEPNKPSLTKAENQIQSPKPRRVESNWVPNNLNRTDQVHYRLTEPGVKRDLGQLNPNLVSLISSFSRPKLLSQSLFNHLQNGDRENNGASKLSDVNESNLLHQHHIGNRSPSKNLRESISRNTVDSKNDHSIISIISSTKNMDRKREANFSDHPQEEEQQVASEFNSNQKEKNSYQSSYRQIHDKKQLMLIEEKARQDLMYSSKNHRTNTHSQYRTQGAYGNGALAKEGNGEPGVNKDDQEFFRSLKDSSRAKTEPIFTDTPNLTKLQKDLKITKDGFADPRSQDKKNQYIAKYRPKRTVTLPQLKDFIEDFRAAKAQYEKKSEKLNAPRETPEEFLFLFIRQKYGLHELVQEWSFVIVDGLKRYSYFDVDVSVFHNVI